MPQDFIGSTKAAKMAFASNFANLGASYKAQLGFTDPEWTAFTSAVTAQQEAQGVADTAKLDAVGANKTSNSQLADIVATIRDAAAVGRTSSLTDEQLATLGITRKSTTPTPIPAPSVAPSMNLDSVSPGSARLRYSTPGSAGATAKPDGAVGCQVSLRAKTSTLPPTSGIMTLATRTPLLLDTTELTESRCIVMARYYNAKGEFGPWSDPIEFNAQLL